MDTSVVVANLVPLLVLLGGYWLGRIEYRRQKEYELVRVRYLDEAVDRVAAQVGEALAVFRQNWTEALAFLKQLRDLGPRVDTRLCAERFVRLDASTLDVRAHYRLNTLVGDMVFWRAHQETVVLAELCRSYIVTDLCEAARLVSEGHEPKPDRLSLCESYLEVLQKLDGAALPHYQILAQLQALAAELENRNLGFRAVRHFRSREKVRGVLTTANAIYAEHLAGGLVKRVFE